MLDSFNYRTNKEKISQDKMQFNIINRRPKFSPQKKETAKAEIEKQLFAVFCKYV